jgi:DNA-binding transcriptional LysR family regulator
MQILALIEEAEAGDAYARPFRELRVRTPAGFVQHYLIKAIGAYQKLYPEVQVRLTLANGMPDFIEDGCDVAIVGTLALSDSEFISQKVGSAFSIVCASRTYIEAHGVPHTPDDLEAHSCIHLNTPEFPMNVWTFDGPNGEESVRFRPALLEVNTPEGARSRTAVQGRVPPDVNRSIATRPASSRRTGFGHELPFAGFVTSPVEWLLRPKKRNSGSP